MNKVEWENLDDPWNTQPFRGFRLLGRGSWNSVARLSDVVGNIFDTIGLEITNTEYKVAGSRVRAKRVKSTAHFRELFSGISERPIYITGDRIHFKDHTKCDAFVGFWANEDRSFDDLRFVASCFDHLISLDDAAKIMRRAVAEMPSLYGFSAIKKGVFEAMSFHMSLLLPDDPPQAKRTEFLRKIVISGELLLSNPFLDLFDLNVLSDVHLSSQVGGKFLDVYIARSGYGVLERITAENWIWVVTGGDLSRAKRDLQAEGLLALREGER